MKQETRGYISNIINIVCTGAIIYFSVFHVTSKTKLDKKADIFYVDARNTIQNEQILNNVEKIKTNTKSIIEVRKTNSDIKAMVTDIWKTLFIEKNK